MRWTVKAAALLLMLGCRESEPVRIVAAAQRPDASVPARATEAARGYLGVVVARESADITAPVEGPLLDVKVELGQRVAAGDVLATVDPRIVERALKTQQAVLRGAQADRARANAALRQAVDKRQRLESIEGMVAAEKVSTSRFEEEQAHAELAAAGAAVQEAQAEVSRLDAQRADTSIRAPFAGVVAARYLDAGSVAGPGKPIVRLIGEGAPWVRFAVPEEEAGRVRSGVAAHVKISGADSPLPARVVNVAPEVDTASRMVVAEAELVGQESVIVGQVTRVFID